MFDKNLIHNVVKQVINETVEFSRSVPPNQDALITGDKIERKIWYYKQSPN